jgi:rare lipoprotein A (peptidoglycan hydrolase)
MPSLVPRALGRRAAVAAIAALALPGAVTTALATPDAPAPDGSDVVLLTREDSRLAAEADRLEARLDAERSALAAARGRLDSARADYETALGEVQRRVVEVYKQDDLDPGAALLAGGPDEAAAVLDLKRAINRGDGATLARFRLSVSRLDAAEDDVAARKGALTEGVQQLEVRRTALQGRIETAKAASETPPDATPVAPPAAPFSVSVTAATVLGLPYAPPPTYTANERGLPQDVIAARSLPGFFAIDPVTRRGNFGALTPSPAATAGAPSTKPSAGVATFDARASWYTGPSTMADGRPFDADGLTAAHRTLPLGTWLRLSYRDRMVVVRVTDRGPYAGDSDLAVTTGAAQVLGLSAPDTVHVEVVTGPAG